jgi:hypothetical protein
MEVVYTGCGGNCFGLPITPDMTLRQVLDIIVGNCENIQGGSKWYWGDDVPTFPANEGDFYLQSNGVVWEYDEVEGWQETTIDLKGIEWGDISGNVADQTDLVNFINTRITTVLESTIATTAGTGLSYRVADKKIVLGNEMELAPGLIYRTVVYGSGDGGVLYGFPSSTAGMPDMTKAVITQTQSGVSMSVSNIKLDVQSGIGFTYSEDEQTRISAGSIGITINAVTGNLSLHSERGTSIGGFGDTTINAEYGFGGRVLIGNVGDPVLLNPNGSELHLGQLSAGKPGIKLVGSSTPEFRSDGLVVPSADGKRWRLTVSNAGALVITQIV